MKKLLIIFFVLSFSTNAYSQKIFGYFENCFLKSAAGRDVKVFEGMITDKFDKKQYEEMYYLVLTDFIRKKFVMTDFGLKENEKKFKKRFPKREYKPKRILQSSYSIKQLSKNNILFK